MNNNTTTVNSNSTTATCSPSSSAAASKNIPKVNGTNNTDNRNFQGTNDQSSVRVLAPSTTTNSTPCSTCQYTSSSSSSNIQNNPQSQQQAVCSSTNDHIFQNCNNVNIEAQQGNNALPPNLSTGEDDETHASATDSDDQYCVYTYKGDGSSQQPSRLAADLPSSFFKLHPSDSSSCPPSNSSSEIPSLEPTSSSSGSRCCHSSLVSNGSRQHYPPATMSMNSTNNNAMYSPDMDFLEMDFDPGGSGDGCCDGDDEDEEEDIVRDHLYLRGGAGTGGGSGVSVSNNLPTEGSASTSNATGGKGEAVACCSSSVAGNNQVLNDDQASAAAVLSKLVVTRSNGGDGGGNSSTSSSSTSSIAASSSNATRHIFSSSSSSSSEKRAGEMNDDPVPHCSKRINTYAIPPDVVTGQNLLLNNVMSSRNDEIKLRLVKSLTLPEISSSCVSGSGNTALCCCASGGGVSCNSSVTNRAMAMSISAPVFTDKLNRPCPTVIPAGKSSEDSVELEVEGVMLWSVQEAREISMSQIGPSACGATACLNVLSALGCIMTTLSPEFVSNCVGTRLRADRADLPEYLLSRFNAGTTHEDLIAGINRASNGLIYGRFFQIKPNTLPGTLNKWLLHWICKGAVPIATLNLQVRRPGDSYSGEIPDAWHHQMIFGVTKQGIYLTNPLECVPTVELIPQLSSPSVLLVRREDVTRRMGPRTDLRKLVRFPDLRWNDMNVLGQVGNMLLEEIPVVNGNGLARRMRTSHISIPAAYTAGITLFVRVSNTTSYDLLKAAPEF